MIDTDYHWEDATSYLYGSSLQKTKSSRVELYLSITIECQCTVRQWMYYWLQLRYLKYLKNKEDSSMLKKWCRKRNESIGRSNCQRNCSVNISETICCVNFSFKEKFSLHSKPYKVVAHVVCSRGPFKNFSFALLLTKFIDQHVLQTVL